MRMNMSYYTCMHNTVVADVGGISASDEEGGSCSATADSDSPAVKKRKLEE